MKGFPGFTSVPAKIERKKNVNLTSLYKKKKKRMEKMKRNEKKKKKKPQKAIEERCD